MKKNEHQTRRSFLKKGIATAAGSAFMPTAFSQEPLDNTSKVDDKLLYRTLGRTDIKLPVVSMGAGDTDNARLLGYGLDNGLKLVATSQYYGNGNNEKVVAEAIKGRERDSFVVMSSAMPAGIDHKNGVYTDASSEDDFLKKFDGSLERLGLEQIDIFLLPFAAKRESVFYKPLLSAMEKIKLSGKAKYVGIATHSWESEAIRAAIETELYDVVMTAYNFKHQNGTDIANALAEAHEAGLGTIAMKTMAGAYWDKERTQSINTKAALKWVLNNEHVHTTVPGITAFDQLQQNINLMGNISLSNAEWSDLKLSQTNHSRGIYCQQCGACVSQCAEQLDIPTAMRSYMYAFGYKNLAHAKQTYKWSAVNSNACNGCTRCSVSCPMGFDVKEKLASINEIDAISDSFLS